MIPPSPIDVADLRHLFLVDYEAAIAQLVELTPTQLTVQAYAYAAYCEDRGARLQPLTVLAQWNDDIARAVGV